MVFLYSLKLIAATLAADALLWLFKFSYWYGDTFETIRRRCIQKINELETK